MTAIGLGVVPTSTRPGLSRGKFRVLHAMPRPLRRHVAHPLNQRVIFGVCRFLVQDLHRLSIQVHKLSLEADPVDSGDIVPEIVLKEQSQTVRVAERGPLHGHILDLRRL